MVDVFDEVEEEMRQEQYNALLRKWGPWVGGAAAAIVIGVGAYQFITWSGEQRANAASDQYQAASELFAEGNSSAADAGFEALTETGPAGYATLSLMRRGDIAFSEGRTADAARFYAQAAERAPEPMTRDLARYQAALALFDELSFDDLSLRLEPLTEGAAPVGMLARELIAVAAVRDERWDEARSRYELLAIGLDVPPGMSQRITEALAVINQRAPQPVIETPVEDSPVEAPVSDSEAEAPVDASQEPSAVDAAEQEEDGQ